MVVGVGVEVVVPFRVFHVLLVTEFAVEHAPHLGRGVSNLLFLVGLCLCGCVGVGVGMGVGVWVWVWGGGEVLEYRVRPEPKHYEHRDMSACPYML